MNNGAGAALLKQPHLAVQIVEAVRRAVTLPVTVKLRAGWDKINVREFAQRMEDAGGLVPLPYMVVPVNNIIKVRLIGFN